MKQKQKQEKSVLTLIIGMICLFSGAEPANSQMLHSATNMALGGGGTAYTTGYESLFVNPANLYIREKSYRLQISAGAFGLQTDSPSKLYTPRQLRGYYLSLTEGSGPYPSTGPTYERQRTLDRNFRSNRLRSENASGGELHWFGLHWSGEARSYAIAARTRFASRFETGRGFYDPNWLPVNTTFEIDRSLVHRYQVLHELAIGYAESFSFLSGHFPHLSQVSIGIAPKLVIPGAMLQTEIEDRYVLPDEGGTRLRHRSVDHLSTGRFSEWTSAQLSPFPMIYQPMDRKELFRPSGFGAGFDIGLTWMITLGDDLSTIRELQQRTRRSLRISLSITDLGFVRYRRNPLHLSGQQITEETEMPDVSDNLFMGLPGEHIPFLLENGNQAWLGLPPEPDDLTLMLPTSLNAGLLLQIDRVKVMGDLSLGLTRDAFQSTRLISYFGAEVRPLSFLPLRGGVRLAPNLANYYSAGFGFETGPMELGFSVQFRSRSGLPSGELSGVSVGSIRVLLP